MMATIISRRMMSVIIMQHVSLREHFCEGGVGIGRDKRWVTVNTVASCMPLLGSSTSYLVLLGFS